MKWEEIVVFIKDIVEMLCSCNLLLITGASVVVGIMAYRAQVKSILINQWTTFKILLEDQEETYSSLLLQKSSEECLDENLREETIAKIMERRTELKRDIDILESKLGLRKNKH